MVAELNFLSSGFLTAILAKQNKGMGSGFVISILKELLLPASGQLLLTPFPRRIGGQVSTYDIDD
jgi:hypothetical protein